MGVSDFPDNVVGTTFYEKSCGSEGLLFLVSKPPAASCTYSSLCVVRGWYTSSQDKRTAAKLLISDLPKLYQIWILIVRDFGSMLGGWTLTRGPARCVLDTLLDNQLDPLLDNQLETPCGAGHGGGSLSPSGVRLPAGRQPRSLRARVVRLPKPERSPPAACRTRCWTPCWTSCWTRCWTRSRYPVTLPVELWQRFGSLWVYRAGGGWFLGRGAGLALRKKQKQNKTLALCLPSLVR